MINVNNLCFDPVKFLRLLGESEHGDHVFLNNTAYGNFWRGENQKNFYIISIVRDPLEIESILERFCPLTLGSISEGESGIPDRV